MPAIERVDVLELEPVIRRVARDCAPVNRDALANPKVHIWHGDAREAMLTSRRQYDVIASEPSNPYRAGVASLFTKEFYEAAARRLRPNGLFAQWVQAYEIDGESVSTIYATLASVFPYIETWCMQSGDLAFIAGREPLVHDVAELRRRVGQEPYRSALAQVWRVTDLEGFFAHFVGRSVLADAVVANARTVSTDDRNWLEFAFAKGNLTEALQAWRRQAQEPGDLLELLLVAQALASESDTNALPYIEQLRRWLPVEADAVLAEYHFQNDDHAAFDLAEKVLRAHRTDPWPRSELMAGTLTVALRIATEANDNSYSMRLAEVLREPFAVGLLDSLRMQARLTVAGALDRRRGTHFARAAVAEFEPHVPWTKDFLRVRLAAYRLGKDAMAAKAGTDWARFSAGVGRPLLISTREQLAEAARPGPGRSPAPRSGIDRVQAREP